MCGTRCRLGASRIMRRGPGGPLKRTSYWKRMDARGAALAKKNWISAGGSLLQQLQKKRESQAEEQRVEREIRILADGAAIAKRAAQEFVQAASAAVRERGAFHVALAGGSTPKVLYGLLAGDPLRSQVPWDKIQVFFGDERHVGPGHADSNFRIDRKSTRLNSSHMSISYAVFRLKKKSHVHLARGPLRGGRGHHDGRRHLVLRAVRLPAGADH